MEELKAEISHCFGISQHTEPCRCPGFRGGTSADSYALAAYGPTRGNPHLLWRDSWGVTALLPARILP